MDIRLKSHVECTDGRIGRLENVILNPKTQKVTYLVVKENDVQNTLRLVSEHLIEKSSPETISLSINKERFKKMKPFIQEEYIPSNITLYMAEMEGWDMGTPASVFVEREAVPAGGIVVRKGEKVFATDGHVGQVDEFLVEQKAGRITHLILREGHLWGKKDISIPVNQIDRYEEGDIRLKIDKRQVEALPVIDLKPH
ncbi:MAG: PRC-barrel domain-containing protein [Deltaproteobacteria bacterium]|nr:PRC-barrel domain-containing protein [Deltaproteobacteria bacterium]